MACLASPPGREGRGGGAVAAGKRGNSGFGTMQKGQSSRFDSLQPRSAPRAAATIAERPSPAPSSNTWAPSSPFGGWLVSLVSSSLRTPTGWVSGVTRSPPTERRARRWHSLGECEAAGPQAVHTVDVRVGQVLRQFHCASQPHAVVSAHRTVRSLGRASAYHALT